MLDLGVYVGASASVHDPFPPLARVTMVDQEEDDEALLDTYIHAHHSSPGTGSETQKAE